MSGENWCYCCGFCLWLHACLCDSRLQRLHHQLSHVLLSGAQPGFGACAASYADELKLLALTKSRSIRMSFVSLKLLTKSLRQWLIADSTWPKQINQSLMYIIPISEDRTRRSLSWSPEAIDSLCKEVDGARVRFLGTPFFEKYDRVIVSFPGAHGRAWNKLIQGAGGWKTSCVFLPDEDAPGYGVHVKNDFPQCCHAIWGVTPCFCHMLYGQPEPWGCRWYQMLLAKETVCFFCFTSLIASFQVI